MSSLWSGVFTIHDGNKWNQSYAFTAPKAAHFQSVTMLCQRCLNDEEALYRVYSDIMDIVVCPSCADDARRLEIPVVFLDETQSLVSH